MSGPHSGTAYGVEYDTMNTCSVRSTVYIGSADHPSTEEKKNGHSRSHCDDGGTNDGVVPESPECRTVVV